MIPLLGAILGFIIFFTKLLGAMGESKLLPRLFCWKDSNGQFIFARWFGLMMCLVINLLSVFVVDAVTVFQLLFCLNAFAYWIAQLIGFIVLRMIMVRRHREFQSPLGIGGALYALLIFGLGFISSAALQPHSLESIVVFVSLTVCATAYYLFVGKWSQTFSDEEKAIMFDAHIILCKYCTVIFHSECQSK